MALNGHPRIGVLSGKGGTGKTATAVALATWWAENRGPATLVDCDPQETESAAWWLDKSDDKLAGLSWTKATIPDLVNHLGAIDQMVIVDTPPRLDDPSLHDVAKLVDLVLIPGSISEFSSMLQTFRTVRQTTAAPIVAVITRTATGSLNAAGAGVVLDVLRAEGLGVAGAIRQSNQLAEAVATGRRPDQLHGDARIRIGDDLRTLMYSVDNILMATG